MLQSSSHESIPGDEERLLRGVSRGDQSAFWQLWLMHHGHLYSICLRCMDGVAADAADAVSRSMLTAFARMPAHASGIVNLQAWLTRLARNVCIDMQRERLRTLCGAIAVDELLPGHQAPIDPRPTPEEQAAGNEVVCSIHRRIESLPHRVREVARMRFLQEKAYDTIARELSITEATARKRVQQARTRLRVDEVHKERRGGVFKETTSP